MIPKRIENQLDPVFAAWLRATHVELPPGFVPTPEQMRAAFAQMLEAVNNPADESLTVTDNSITSRDGHAIGIRHYHHAGDQRPVCIFMHGGGWVLGNLDTHNGLCSDIAMQAGCDVIAIDYRLSPEHKFPAALNDCEDVVRAIAASPDDFNVDASHMAVMGDSAGGSLAAGVCLRLQNSDVTLKAQVLVYPALAKDMDAPSYQENADVPGLTLENMMFYFIAYAGDPIPDDPLLAPLSVTELGGVPPAMISVAQFDPLRDDGTQYAAKLEEAGVAVQFRIEPGVGHSYLWLRSSSAVCGGAFSALTAFLREKL